MVLSLVLGRDGLHSNTIKPPLDIIDIMYSDGPFLGVFLWPSDGRILKTPVEDEQFSALLECSSCLY